jgi:uncharacterized protein YdeI (YjbR/CyaY-like superfamily)
MVKLEVKILSKAQLHKWFLKNYGLKEGVWIIYPKKSSDKFIDLDVGAINAECLCFGWIDSSIKRVDEEYSGLYITQRNPKSNWSKVNKDKVKELIKDGCMKKSGMALINIAKQNGCWVALDGVEKLDIPIDLLAALNKSKIAKSNFDKFPRSAKRGILEYLLNAKKVETRINRISKIVEDSKGNIRTGQNTK